MGNSGLKKSHSAPKENVPDVEESLASAAAEAAAALARQAPVRDVSKYTALLGTLLGGCLPASVAIFQLVSRSPTWVRFCVFGGVTFGVFAIASGLIVGHLGKTARTISYTRSAAMVAFATLLTFFTAGLCTLLASVRPEGAYVAGVVGGVCIFALGFLWNYYDW